MIRSGVAVCALLAVWGSVTSASRSALWSLSLPSWNVSMTQQDVPTASVGSLFIVGDPQRGVVYGVNTSSQVVAWNVSGFAVIYELTTPVADDVAVVGVRSSTGVALLNADTGALNATLSVSNAADATLHIGRRVAVVTEYDSSSSGSSSASSTNTSSSGSATVSAVNSAFSIATGSPMWTHHYSATATLADAEDYFYFTVSAYPYFNLLVVDGRRSGRLVSNITTVWPTFIRASPAGTFAMIRFKDPQFVDFVDKATGNVTSSYKYSLVAEHGPDNLAGQWVDGAVTFTDRYDFAISALPNGTAAWANTKLSVDAPRNVFVRDEGVFVQLVDGGNSASSGGSSHGGTTLVIKLKASDGTQEWRQELPSCAGCFLDLGNENPFLVLRNGTSRGAMVILSRYDGTLVVAGDDAASTHLEVSTTQRVSATKRLFATVSSTGTVRVWQL